METGSDSSVTPRLSPEEARMLMKAIEEAEREEAEEQERQRDSQAAPRCSER